MNKHGIGLLLALVLAVATLSGCGSAPETPPTPITTDGTTDGITDETYPYPVPTIELFNPYPEGTPTATPVP